MPNELATTEPFPSAALALPAGFRANTSGGGSGDPIFEILSQIRDTLRMLLIVTIKKSEGQLTPDFANRPQEEKEKRSSLWSIVDDALMGTQARTGLGRLFQRVRVLGGRVAGQIKKATGRGAKAGAAAAGSRVAAGTGAGAGAIGGAATGAGIAVIFAVAVTEFGKAVYDFARAQEQEIRRLAQFGGQQALGTAMLDAERTMRDIKTAQETGQSSLNLTESISRFEDALQPIESLITNIANSVGSGLLDMLTGMLDAIRPGVEIIKAIYDVLPWRKGKFEETKFETNWEVLNRIERQQLEQLRDRKPGPIPAGPKGGPMPYGGKI